MNLPSTQHQAQSWHWTGTATLESIREASLGIRNFLIEAGADEAEACAWELAVSEAGNNVAIHSVGGSVDILTTLTPSKTIIRIKDDSPGFDWPGDVSLPPEDDESGRGLFLIQELTDSRTYCKSDKYNILELERNYQFEAAPEEDLESTLIAMTEELSFCYESLASIFHFIVEARETESLQTFASSLLEHLSKSTATSIGFLRICHSDGTMETLAHYGIDDIPCVGIEGKAIQDRADQWIEEAIPEFDASEEMVGMVHPFYSDGELIGSIMLARTAGCGALNAGEVNMIHTFAEFFIQHILSRKHEEEAIQSSVARHEVQLAANIQNSLMPTKPQPVMGAKIDGECQSALSVGGDFYDIIALPGVGYFFVIADVMGKGVAASLIAAVTRSVIRSVSDDFLQPAQLLGKVARLMYEDLDRLEMFVTIAVGVIDMNHHKVRIANAGHCPVVVVTDEVSEATPSNPPLGIEDEPDYLEHVIQLTENSKLLAYTDGFTDSRNGPSSFESEDAVTEWFHSIAPECQGLEELKATIQSRLGQNQDESKNRADDQTYVIMTT
ncbi:SpoIIE family protein phosphatase [Rubritalea marina]|uniref:SpoIIE family protein phosphatase n=1 Tax=Rubritalea marina TaxID=361055 RepID=UPI0003616CFF|nr:SpoIIE family protein phosphatase [Rubritalea marina]